MSRQLDAAIAETLATVDGITVAFNNYRPCIVTPIINDDGSCDYLWEVIPAYSTDGNAMLELDREMRKRGGELDELYYDPKSTNGEWYALYGGKFDAYGGRAHSEPLARALAAYKALTGKEWEGD